MGSILNNVTLCVGVPNYVWVSSPSRPTASTQLRLGRAKRSALSLLLLCGFCSFMSFTLLKKGGGSQVQFSHLSYLRYLNRLSCPGGLL